MPAASGDWIAMIDADVTYRKTRRQPEMAQDADVIYTAAFNFEDVDRVEPVTFSRQTALPRSSPCSKTISLPIPFPDTTQCLLTNGLRRVSEYNL